MPAPPTVSAIIPTYQRRGALGAVVNALLADQSLHELIVAVDGSTDGTVEILLERRSRDPRLIVVELPGRGVPSPAPGEFC